MPRRNGAPRMVGDMGSSVADGAGDYLRQGRDVLRELDDRIEDSVREHPLLGIATAVGIGVAIGIFLTLACPASFPQLKGRS
jgi:hypothetical protein